MNFSFWPFFWFGLPGRLLKLLSILTILVPSIRSQLTTKSPISSLEDLDALILVTCLHAAAIQEDVNGEKLTMKKWWIFGADFSRFTQSFSRFIRDINGEKNPGAN